MNRDQTADGLSEPTADSNNTGGNLGDSIAKLRLLAVGGIHVFDGPGCCTLMNVQPANAVKSLHWTNSLALEAECEGSAEVICETERYSLAIVQPNHLAIVLIAEDELTGLVVNERFRVQA